MAQRIKIAIAGGGTGGHVLPAISVVEELRGRDLEVEFLWIGSEDGVEREEARKAGIPFRAVHTGKLRRYLDRQTPADLVRIPVGILEARRILSAYQPNVIFSTGGFVSVPTVVAGSRIAPIVTHEQTTILGLATTVNLRFADALALSYEQTRTRVKSPRTRVVVTGNPVRGSLSGGSVRRARARFQLNDELPVLYVTGGARGASPLNSRIDALLPEILDLCQVIHQTGPATANDDAAKLREKRNNLEERLKGRYVVTEFFGSELADVFALADLVLSRSGAGTIAELAFLGKPAILIPLPLSGGGEQDVNARALSEAGAAIAIAQDQATPSRILDEIAALFADRTRLTGMAKAAKSLGRPDAAKRLADLLIATSAG